VAVEELQGSAANHPHGQRAAACPVPIDYIGADAQALPVGDASVDSALSAWTLCIIPDASRALAISPGVAVRAVRQWQLGPGRPTEG